MGKRINLISLIFTSALFWFLNFSYPNIYLNKLFYTFFSLAVIYLSFRLVFEEIFTRRIKDSKTKYSFKKAVSILYLFVFFAIFLRIWVENTQTILVAYGLLAAGLAVSLQDLLKNFAGGVTIFVTGIYRVGDRIEINSKFGDVIDIGILYTTLMELKEWVGGEQATGRLTIIPNEYVLSSNVNNYTKDHSFIWDEITLPIKYDSNWKGAFDKILSIVRKETGDIVNQAENEISKLEEKYYLPKKVVEPSIYITPTDNWITFSIRYTVEVRQRRFLRNKLSQMILKEIEQSEDIKIASETLDITAFPEIKWTKNEGK